MSHVVFIESNTTGTGRIAVERRLARGDRVTFLTRSPEKYPFLTAPSPNLELINLETNDAESVATAVTRLSRETTVDAILTFSDFYVDIVAEVAARLGFPYLSPRAARTCRNKPLTRQALRAAGLPTPDFQPIRSPEAARRLGETIGYPCVVKPPADSSSYGVRVVRDTAELLAHVRFLAAETANVRGQKLDGSVLVESYIEGSEYSVETVTLPGGSTRVIGITDKHLGPPPHFVETGHDFPSVATPEIQRAITAAVEAALAAVGFDFGPAHTEVRWTPAGPVIIEINPRLAGGMIPELVRYSTGIDLLDVFFELLFGKTPALQSRRSDTAGVRFLLADRSGRLAGVRGIDRVWRLPTIREVYVGKVMGTAVQPPENAYHRLGFIVAAGTDRRQVQNDLALALETLRVEVDEETTRPE